MRNNYRWLIATLVAALLIGSAITINKQNQVKEANLNNQIEQLKEQSKARSEADKQKLQKRELELQQQVRELNEKLQSKVAEKARIAAETAQKASLAQKATSAIVPTANASQVPQNASDNHSLVTKWANHYGVDPAWMHRVVKCESGYRSNAVNGSYWAQGSTPTGIAQFLASTYIANARRIGLPAIDERLNPDRSLQVMAWMFSIGQWTQWECR